VRRVPLIAFLFALYGSAAICEEAPSAEDARFFEQEVKPLLVQECLQCHGAGEKIRGGLRIDTREAFLKGGELDPGFVPGDPDESLTVRAVLYEDPELEMPPWGKLEEGEVETLVTWIRKGAPRAGGPLPRPDAIAQEEQGEEDDTPRPKPPPTPEEVTFFKTRVWPVLEESCLRCHGGRRRVKGDLHLTSREGMLHGGYTGPAVMPGDPERSLLVHAIRYVDPDLSMPPDERLSDEAIADLYTWVKAGAVWPEDFPPKEDETQDEKSDEKESDGRKERDEPQQASVAPGEAAYWAFRPVTDPPVPDVRNGQWPLGDLDRFVLAGLEARGLVPAPDAGRRTWLRRVTLDLTGLPPTPDEVRAFLADDAPGAFERVADRLLDSPRYGERWGRHWLDVARYADTAGDSSDYPIPQAARYRDWVIDAVQSDLPFDAFVQRQIAGDLLAERGEVDHAEGIVATGYLALSRRFGVGKHAAPHLVIEDTIDTIGRSLLGMTLRCARCHDHEYDPISTEEYYGLYGVFASTRYPFPGSENQRYPENLVPLASGAQAEAALAPFRAERERRQRAVKEAQERVDALEAGPERAEAGKALAAAKRALEAHRREPPPVEVAYAVVEGKPRDVKVHVGGNPSRAGEVVPRGFPDAIDGEIEAEPIRSGSGRLELARWITRPDHPLTARVVVNRIWHHHFGRGLVASLDNFGALGTEPTHPELLDHLARRFVASGWSRKALHRSIVLSRTYRQSSVATPEAIASDPDSRWLSRYPRRRLDAEALRDALLFVSGQLDLSRGGPHPFPPVAKWNYTQHTPFRAVYASDRRSVYLMQQRIRRHPYFARFDGADTNACTAGRTSSTTPLQALWFQNGELLHRAASGLADGVSWEHAAREARVVAAHERAWGRPPTDAERERALAYLDAYASAIRDEAAPPVLVAAGQVPAPADPERAALESYARVLLSSNEFAFLQ